MRGVSRRQSQVLRTLVSIVANDNIIIVVGDVKGVVRSADLFEDSDEADLDRAEELCQGPSDVAVRPLEQTLRTDSQHLALGLRGCSARCLRRSCLGGLAWFPVARQYSLISS